MHCARWCSRNYLPRARSWCGCRCHRTSRLLVSLSSTTLEVLHVSLEVGEVKLGLAGHSIVASLPCPPIVGAVVSSTVMV